MQHVETHGKSVSLQLSERALRLAGTRQTLTGWLSLKPGGDTALLLIGRGRYIPKPLSGARLASSISILSRLITIGLIHVMEVISSSSSSKSHEGVRIMRIESRWWIACLICRWGGVSMGDHVMYN
jgi:hypothetical protein